MKKSCRYCVNMEGYGTEGPMKCNKDLSKGNKTAENCQQFKGVSEWQQ